MNSDKYVKLQDLSDGTTCDNCNRIILTKLGMNYKINNNNFCCRQCADEHEEASIDG